MFESIGQIMKKQYGFQESEPFDFSILQKRAVDNRIKEGEFFLDKNISLKECDKCGKLRKIIPAKSLWQKEIIEGYFMFEKCYYEDQNIQKKDIEIYKEQVLGERIVNNQQYVIKLDFNTVYYISQKEKDEYLSAFEKNPNLKAFRIRDLILTRIYDIIPSYIFENEKK